MAPSPSLLPSHPPNSTHTTEALITQISEQDQAIKWSSSYSVDLRFCKDWKHGPEVPKHISVRARFTRTKFLVPKKILFLQRWLGGHPMGSLYHGLQTNQAQLLLPCIVKAWKASSGRTALTSRADFWFSWSTLPSTRCRNALWYFVAASLSLITTWYSSSWTTACSCLYLCQERHGRCRCRGNDLAVGSQEKVCALISAGQGTGMCRPVEPEAGQREHCETPYCLTPLMSGISDSPQGKGKELTLSQPE